MITVYRSRKHVNHQHYQLSYLDMEHLFQKNPEIIIKILLVRSYDMV